MRTMVTLGWDLRWTSPGHNPMRGVKYTAGSTEQGQGAEFVREEDRPEFAAVEKLVLAYEKLAAESGIPWLAERALVGARFGPGAQGVHERSATARGTHQPDARTGPGTPQPD